MHRRSPWTWLLTAALAWAACGPAGEAELVITADPRNIASNGLESSLITVTARDENGLVGKGTVRITSVNGSLKGGVDVELDAYGKATAVFTCDKALDADCTGDVRVVAEWARAGKQAVSSSLRVGIDGAGTGTGGSGGGSGGGTAQSCPNNFPLCSAHPNAAVFEGRYLENPMKFWRVNTLQIPTHEQVMTQTVELGNATCSGTTCDSITVRARDLTFDAGVDPADIITWDGRDTSTVDTTIGGSMDNPTLRVARYTDGKRQPPVPSQPVFSSNLCPGPVESTFDICKLDVQGGTVRELLLTFDVACVQSSGERVRGCIHLTVP